MGLKHTFISGVIICLLGISFSYGTNYVLYFDNFEIADNRPANPIKEITDCFEFPDLINTYSSHDEVCINENFALSTDYETETGVTYKWFKSADGLFYTPIPGAISPALITNQLTSSYYKCRFICDFSGDIVESSPVFVPVRSPEICGYCNAIYAAGSAEGDYISQVTLNEINKTSGYTLGDSYVLYDDASATIFKGLEEEITIAVGSYFEGNSFCAWIDFNKDFIFSGDEIVANGYNLAPFATITNNFTVPLDALTGETRMRVREVYLTEFIDPCFIYQFGETEDYMINIIELNAPAADFNYDGDPLVNFTDNSEGIVSNWMWNFGDGATSTLTNPNHLFVENGTYTVCLTVENIAGSDSKCKEVVIANFLAPEVNFTLSGDPVVTFTDLTINEPYSWLWSFGDGYSSTEQNPTHTYSENGIYSVCLWASNDYGSNSSCQLIEINGLMESPEALFSFDGEPEVIFTDLSSGVPTEWYWDFGDGTISTEQNPLHLFLENGTFEVCLTASNLMGEQTYCQVVIIDNYLAPVSAFSFTGDPTVYFTDLSSNAPNSWLWNFGDGSFSTLQNPIHTFISNGLFNACLTSANGGGVSTNCVPVTIIGCLPAPVCAFNYTIIDNVIYFEDLSDYNPESWQWYFGDGSSSELASPAHIYVETGTYEVCLTVQNQSGESVCCQTINTADVAVPVQKQNFDLDIFPNPSDGFIHLVIPQNISTRDAAFTVVAMDGRAVYPEYEQINPTEILISFRDLPSGMYQINYIVNNGVFTAHVVINK